MRDARYAIYGRGGLKDLVLASRVAQQAFVLGLQVPGGRDSSIEKPLLRPLSDMHI